MTRGQAQNLVAIVERERKGTNGLMSYNAASAMHQLATEDVVRILKGEKPA